MWKTLQKGIFAGPERDMNLRNSLEERLEASGTETLYAELVAMDIEFAEKIKPTDRTRILRGLEINLQLKMNVQAAQVKFPQES